MIAAAAAAATEDFSFPSITTNDYSSPPRFIGSPTLWHRSSSCSPSSRHGTRTVPAESKLADQPAPAHDHDDEIDQEHNNDPDQQQYYWRRSFSFAGRSRGARTPPPRRAGILFKEDGIGSTHEVINDVEEEEKMDMLWEDLNELELQSEITTSCQLDSPGRMANFGCVSLQLSRGGDGTVVIGKKPNVRLFVRVLKKLFMLHNSQRSLKKQRTW